MPLDPRRLYVENVINLRQYERGLRDRVQRILQRSLEDINGVLVSRYGNLTRFQKERMIALFKRTDEMIRSAYAQAGKLSAKEALGLAKLQSTFAENVIRAVGDAAGVEFATTRLSVARLKVIVDFPVQGLQLGDWWERQGANMAVNVRRQIQLGLIQGQTTGQIVGRLTSTAQPSALVGMRRTSEMLVRTAVTAISAEAQFETFSALDPDVTDSYRYVATLDDRTTIICAELDGQVFKYEDENAPRPPMHIGCRSTIIPEVNWEALGVKPPDDLLKMTRASAGGPVTFKTYGSWLRSQPAGVQDEVLGPARGKLFRSGKASLSDLVRNDGTTLTLPQLARKIGVPLAEIE